MLLEQGLHLRLLLFGLCLGGSQGAQRGQIQRADFPGFRINALIGGEGRFRWQAALCQERGYWRALHPS